MFMPINVLLALVLFPFILIFGYPRKMTIVTSHVPEDVVKAFPVSSRTPVVWIEPWGYYRRFMEKRGIRAQAFLLFMILRMEEKTLIFHECVHVIQQSVFTPILVGLVYVLDLLTYAPFHKWFRPRAFMRISSIEKVAYTLTKQDTQLHKDRP